MANISRYTKGCRAAQGKKIQLLKISEVALNYVTEISNETVFRDITVKVKIFQSFFFYREPSARRSGVTDPRRAHIHTHQTYINTPSHTHTLINPFPTRPLKPYPYP